MFSSINNKEYGDAPLCGHGLLFCSAYVSRVLYDTQCKSLWVFHVNVCIMTHMIKSNSRVSRYRNPQATWHYIKSGYIAINNITQFIQWWCGYRMNRIAALTNISRCAILSSLRLLFIKIHSVLSDHLSNQIISRLPIWRIQNIQLYNLHIV